MVKKISKFLAYTAFFVLALIYFAPKVAVYYFVEKKIEPFGVIITDEKVIDNGFSLSLENAVVTLKGIESASIKKVNMKQFIFYNSISLEDITLSAAAASMIPTGVKNVDIHYSIFNPLHLLIKAVGDFGVLEGSFKISDMALHLEVKPSKKMLQSYHTVLRNLKKSKEGAYTYDKTFKF